MNFERNPDAVCKESWWTETDWETFTQRRLEREKVLRPAFGSQPVSVTAPEDRHKPLPGPRGYQRHSADPTAVTP